MGRAVLRYSLEIGGIQTVLVNKIRSNLFVIAVTAWFECLCEVEGEVV